MEGEGEAEEAGSRAVRFREFARDDALRAGEGMACSENLQLDVAADAGDVWVDVVDLVSHLFGDGVAAKVYCSRAPLKLGREFCSTSTAFSCDGITGSDILRISSGLEG